jgi:hypothetical protein
MASADGFFDINTTHPNLHPKMAKRNFDIKKTKQNKIESNPIF